MLSKGINHGILFACQGKRIYQRPFGVERRKAAQKIHTKLQKNFKIQAFTKKKIHGR